MAFLDSCWIISWLLLQQGAAAAVIVMSFWRQAPLFETMDCPSWCSSGEGSLLALPISAADGLETWPLSAEEPRWFHRSPTPIRVPVIKPRSAAQPGVSRGLEGPTNGWVAAACFLLFYFNGHRLSMWSPTIFAPCRALKCAGQCRNTTC